MSLFNPEKQPNPTSFMKVGSFFKQKPSFDKLRTAFVLELPSE